MRPHVLGLDVLGGDHPPEAFIPYLAAVLDQTSSTSHLALFVTSQLVEYWRLGEYAPYLEHPCLQVIPVSTILGMEDTPHAVRQKKASSLVQGITALRDGVFDAFVSIGNTGALVAAATLQLTPLPGVRRLALLAEVPTRKQPAAILDVGATLDPTPDDLLQWTLLGVEHLARKKGRDFPKVGLLNIGKEPYKGTALQKSSYQLLSQPSSFKLPMTFIGNVESEDVYQGNVDLVITEGYSGNIFLKTSEAASNFIQEQLQATMLTHVPSEILNQYTRIGKSGCAYLLGTAFTLIKCHGSMPPHLLPSVIREIQ